MRSDPVIRFARGIAANPVHTRRQSVGRRKSSLWLRLMALGFVSGILAGIAWRLYDWRMGGSAAE